MTINVFTQNQITVFCSMQWIIYLILMLVCTLARSEIGFIS